MKSRGCVGSGKKDRKRQRERETDRETDRQRERELRERTERGAAVCVFER